ncbi:TrmB family transcriptional regulator [Halobellus sp. Atlit-31R]|nr:TrmB family transcriptional regulator [Halobellus sp. Atlit-31R]
MASENVLSQFDLTEYEEKALRELLSLGRTTAPNLSEATGIPKARIYGVLDSLAQAGFIKVIPGRPKQYQPYPPDEIVDRAIESQRQDFEEYRHSVESIREEFVNTYSPVEDRDRDELRPTEDLFHVVDVGEPSERETRRLFREARDRIVIWSKSFGFLDAVAPTLKEATEREVTIQCLLLSSEFLSEENQQRQAEIRSVLRDEYPSIEVRQSDRMLPWRGTFIDPSLEYTSGQGILLVEQEEVPNHMRQAAVTENPSFVAGMWQYFDLLWHHESSSTT